VAEDAHSKCVAVALTSFARQNFRLGCTPEEQTTVYKNTTAVLVSVMPPACWWEGTRSDRPCSKLTQY